MKAGVSRSCRVVVVMLGLVVGLVGFPAMSLGAPLLLGFKDQCPHNATKLINFTGYEQSFEH